MNDNLKLLVEELKTLDPEEQCTGLLKDADGKMCVHGVMCDLYARLTGKGRWAQPKNRHVDWRYEFQLDGVKYTTSAPTKVERFYGLDDYDDDDDLEEEDARQRLDRGVVCLMSLNDGARLPFADLAEAITSHPDQVYV